MRGSGGPKSLSQQQAFAQVPTVSVDVMQAEFDKKLEAKFGLQMLQKVNKEANARVNKGTTTLLNSADAKNAVAGGGGAAATVTQLNYNSFETPENTWEVKRVINQINDAKRVHYQKNRYSSFEAPSVYLGT